MHPHTGVYNTMISRFAPGLALLAALLSMPALSQQKNPAAQTGPAQTGPAQTGPAQTGPAQTKPADSKPSTSTPTLSVDARLVNLPVIVRDKKGALIQNLTKDDFVLSVDSHPQTIRYFDRDNNLPLTLGLLVDTSMSQRSVLDEERTASSTFVDQMLTAPAGRPTRPSSSSSPAKRNSSRTSPRPNPGSRQPSSRSTPKAPPNRKPPRPTRPTPTTPRATPARRPAAATSAAPPSTTLSFSAPMS